MDQKGVQESKAAQYQDAVQSFQKAVDLDPNNMTARLYLATAFMSSTFLAVSLQKIWNWPQGAGAVHPGAQVKPDRHDRSSVHGVLNYQQAQGMPDPEQKIRKLDEPPAGMRS